jgi:hypothetical protein
MLTNIKLSKLDVLRIFNQDPLNILIDHYKSLKRKNSCYLVMKTHVLIGAIGVSVRHRLLFFGDPTRPDPKFESMVFLISN